MAGCANTLTASAPSCAALKMKGGFDKEFYVGNIADLSSVTYGTNQEVTAIAFGSGGLKKVSGKRLKHGAGTTLEPGDNVNMRVQNFNAVLYAKTAEERLPIEQLADAEDIFIIAESNAGVMEVFGINKGDNSQYDNYGLTASAGEWKNGVLLNDDTSVSMTFSGQFDNGPLVFVEASDIPTNRATLDALVV